MEEFTAFLARLPKIELHVHLESTMPEALLERFAAKQGQVLPRPAADLYHCSAEDLSDFLAFLDKICSHVGTEEELAEVAERFSRKAAGEHHLCRGDPQSHALAPVYRSPDHRRGDDRL